MNGQFLPGSSEILNKQTHQRLLKEAASIRKAAAKSDDAPNIKFEPHIPQPRLLEPLISAVITAVIAIQIAFLPGL